MDGVASAPQDARASFLDVRPRSRIHSGNGAASLYLYSTQKRVLDVCVGLLALLMLLPIMIFVATLIKLTSRGPILFKQLRNGAQGDPFTVYKFRSMTQASCRDETVLQATKDDMRITLVGRFIRRTSIDELPQLLNVLRGDMSLIGPRPHALAHDEFYAANIPLYPLRFAARPGMSGLAQVRGARGETPHISDMERRIILDVDYIKTASLKHDIYLLAATAKEVVSSSSAY